MGLPQNEIAKFQNLKWPSDASKSFYNGIFGKTWSKIRRITQFETFERFHCSATKNLLNLLSLIVMVVDIHYTVQWI